MSYDAKGTINKVILIGRIGQEPELKHTGSGVAVLTLSVATNTSHKDQSGNNVEYTEWHRVIVWRKLAEIIAQYGQKGTRVYTEGKLITRQWQDKDGNTRYTTEIQAESMQLLSERGSGSSSGSDDPVIPNSAPPAQPQNDSHAPAMDEADDLPF